MPGRVGARPHEQWAPPLPTVPANAVITASAAVAAQVRLTVLRAREPDAGT
ncbi:hypothetical protein OHU34_04705 [Streptomyces sp. NBC_00080]|uniref:hypothetical protein n=1 Tax=Streptomyces TaxID=1883 RepID=UPI00135CC36D|nr:MULTISPECIES: hypothetical protein [Streptomyces]